MNNLAVPTQTIGGAVGTGWRLGLPLSSGFGSMISLKRIVCAIVGIAVALCTLFAVGLSERGGNSRLLVGDKMKFDRLQSQNIQLSKELKQLKSRRVSGSGSAAPSTTDAPLATPPMLVDLTNSHATVSCVQPFVPIHDRILHQSNTRRIPRVIHVSMKSRCLPKVLASNLQKWKDALQDHSFYFHDDDAVDRLLNSDWPEFPYLLNMIKCIRKGAMKIDIWRLLVLYRYGGLYTDVDNWPGPLLNVSIQKGDTAFFVSDVHNRPSQWFMAMEPRHPIAYYTMLQVHQRVLDMPDVHKPKVIQITGPDALKHGFRQAVLRQQCCSTKAEIFQAVGNKTVRKLHGHPEQSRQVIDTRGNHLEIQGKGFKMKETAYEQMNMIHWHKEILLSDVPQESCMQVLRKDEAQVVDEWLHKPDKYKSELEPRLGKLASSPPPPPPENQEHCDWACYLRRYADLKRTFGSNKKNAAAHYENHGNKEGRNCKCDSSTAEKLAEQKLGKHNTQFSIDPVLAKSLLRTRGDGWAITQSPPSQEGTNGFECNWVQFKATSGQQAMFCAHPFDDIVSKQIERAGRFHHCNGLPTMWNALPKTNRSIYIEIGANIGGCVMEMLLSTDAKIIAFEPHPRNQFAIRSTISKLDQMLRDRFTLVPVGLGAEGVANTIHAARNNFGNSVIGTIVKDNQRQVFGKEDQFPVRVERLDSIISAYPDIPLIKMDCQGYECNVLAGISKALSQQMSTIKFEVAPIHLGALKCTNLLSRLRSLGFDIWSENGKDEIIGETSQFRKMQELLARRTEPKAGKEAMSEASAGGIETLADYSTSVATKKSAGGTMP